MKDAVKENDFQSKSSVCKKKFEITDVIGEDGLWQRCIFVYVFFMFMLGSLNNYSMTFLAPNIDHWCARPQEARNLTVEQWRALAIPAEDQHCSRYEDINYTLTSLNRMISDSNSTVPCESWEYDNTVYRSTLLSQFDLVCDRKWMISFAKSVYLFAGFTKLIWGHLSDWIGRRPVIIISGTIALCSSIVKAFSPWFTMFLFSRFFFSVGITASISTPFVHMMEILGPKYRNMYGMAIALGYSLGLILLPLLAWLIADSFWIRIALIFPCLLLLATWWLPESPRWLLNHGKIKEAENVIIRAAEINGVNLSVERKTALRGIMTEYNETPNSNGSKVNVFHLLKTPGLRKVSLIIFYNWAANGIVYHGLSQNTNELAGNPFVNFALYGIVEIPASFFAIFTLEELGKKNLIGGSMVIGGMACLVSYFLPSDPWWLIVAVTMIGKFCIAISYGNIFIYTSELFPTVTRNIGMVSAHVFGRLFSIASPFMRELGNATHPVVPLIIYAVVAISSGLLVFLLPDTRKCSMPDTLEEAEQFIQRKQNTTKIESRIT